MVNYQEVEEEFLAESPHQLDSLAPQIIDLAGHHTIWLFHGDMGSGKTTLIQAICAAKGVTDQVTSPTYSLLQEYHSAKEIFYHFDFYRLDNAAEALDIGAEEYLDSGKICFIEWPNKIASILPEKHFNLMIEVQDNDSRIIKVHRND